MSYEADNDDVPINSEAELRQYVKYKFDPAVAVKVNAKIDELIKTETDYNDILDQAMLVVDIPDFDENLFNQANQNLIQHSLYLLDGPNSNDSYNSYLDLITARGSELNLAIVQETLRRSVKDYRTGDESACNGKQQSLVELNICCCAMGDGPMQGFRLLEGPHPDEVDIPENVKAVIRVILGALGVDFIYAVVVSDAVTFTAYSDLLVALAARDARGMGRAITRILNRVARSREFQTLMERRLGRRATRTCIGRVLAKFIPWVGWAIFVGSLIYFLYKEWNNIFGQQQQVLPRAASA